MEKSVMGDLAAAVDARFFHLMTLSMEQWTISLPRLMPVCFPI